jgi:glycosidase
MTAYRLLTIFCLCCSIFRATAQLTCDPVFPKAGDNVTITFNAAEGNAALVGFVPIYAHMGVITDRSQSPADWKYVKTIWGTADANGLMEYVSPNVFKKTFNIRSFFGVPASEQILQMAFVFRDRSGNTVGRSADGSDIYYPVYGDNAGLLTKFVAPAAPFQLARIGQSIPVRAAASQSAQLLLLDNGQEITRANGINLETSLNVTTGGLHRIDFVAITAGDRDTASFSYIVPADLPRQVPPAGLPLGISLSSNGRARLALYAPRKQNIYAIGDFNNWQPTAAYQLRNSVDGNTWWLELPEGVRLPTRFQYLVDGTLRIADPLSTLVLDANNDRFIGRETFANLPAYPTGLTTGFVSYLAPPQPFNWQTTNFNRPKKVDLVVYELLVRDFVSARNYKTLQDSLDYLQRLGINAIELMPVQEFSGNLSWGYNPTFHKALDKAYGDPASFKRFVDECHRRGIAVIVDVVFNQIDDPSPLAQLYWDKVRNRPAADNPWLNPTATHEFNVFSDFNHESPATRAYVKNCLTYWLEEYKIDGYRFDLSKGFTQKNTIGSVSAWGRYDTSRIAILKDYAAEIAKTDPSAYVILEHFADNDEEKELAESGMMLWGNMWGGYKEVALGYSGGINTDLRWVSHRTRGWNVPHLIGYMESHDEDRIAYECLSFGNREGDHNIKTLPVALRRIEMLNNLFYTIPGPKMLWQFGELGYDFSINSCSNGSINQSCRTGEKPIRWDYLRDGGRRRLYDRTRALLHLRNTQDAFETNDVQLNLGSGPVRTIYLNDPSLLVAVVANVGMSATTATVNFQKAGIWYDYYSGQTVTVPAERNLTFNLGPGEYRLFLDKFVALPVGVTSTTEQSGDLRDVAVYPNPATDQVLVTYRLETASTVQLSVYDAMGRLIGQYQNDRVPSGDYQATLDTQTWPSGLYTVQIQDEKGGLIARKLVRL